MEAASFAMEDMRPQPGRHRASVRRHGVAVIARGDPGDRVVFASEALTGWLGLADAEVLEHGLSALVVPECVDELAAAISTVLSSGHTRELSLRCNGPRGQRAQVLVSPMAHDSSGEQVVTLQFLEDAQAPGDAADPSLHSRLHFASLTEQLVLVFQPVADLATGRVTAQNALLRWRSAQGGLTSPARILELAEKSQLSAAIGNWALEQACRALQGWDEAGLNPVNMSLKLTPMQLAAPDLALRVGDTLALTAIAPQRVTIDIDEAALTADPDTAAASLASLRAIGLHIGLDHFGTGVSSLKHLKEYPIDQVKIDASLIANSDGGGVDAAMVRSIIQMAHEMGLQVTGAGVETLAQCSFLAENGCDFVQGNFLAAPLAADAAARALRAGVALPAQVARKAEPPRILLLVDDEINVISALRRLLRRDGYQIISATSGAEGLNLLTQHAVDVIVSDQRMPGMTGSEFLLAAKQRYPETIRIMLSGYTELQSVTDSVNSGAIYKFLTKPWDDEQLREHVAEAFRLKRIADENVSLGRALRKANDELARANREMEALLRQMQQQNVADAASLGVARELLEFLPVPVIGVDTDGEVAFANSAASTLFEQHRPLLGRVALSFLPEHYDSGDDQLVHVNGDPYLVHTQPMGTQSHSRGTMVIMRHFQEHP